MNGIEKITGKILDEANADAQKIIEQAKAEAEKILETYKNKAVVAAAEIEEVGGRQAIAQEKKHESNAGLEARKTLLQKKQELISQAFDTALNNLCSLPAEQYIDLLARLAANASENGAEQVIFSQEDKEKYGQKIIVSANEMLKNKGKNGQLTVSEKTRPITGGIVLVRGDVEVNAALDELVRMQRDSLSAQVAEVLFQ